MCIGRHLSFQSGDGSFLLLFNLKPSIYIYVYIQLSCFKIVHEYRNGTKAMLRRIPTSKRGVLGSRKHRLSKKKKERDAKKRCIIASRKSNRADFIQECMEDGSSKYHIETNHKEIERVSRKWAVGALITPCKLQTRSTS